MVQKIKELLSTSKRVIHTELAFASSVMEPLYQTITLLQKQSSGISDVLSTFIGCAALRLLLFLMFICRLKETLGRQPQEWPYVVRQSMKNMAGDAANKLHKLMKQCCEVLRASLRAMPHAYLYHFQAIVDKADTLLVKIVQPKAIKAAKALAAFCPANLQTARMLGSQAMREAVPLVNVQEWEKYITLPAGLFFFLGHFSKRRGRVGSPSHSNQAGSLSGSH